MKPIKINIPNKGIVYWDDRIGKLTGEREAVRFLRKKINAAVISHKIIVFDSDDEYVEDSILATMGYCGMYEVLTLNNIPLPDEIIGYYLFEPDLIPENQLNSYLERSSNGEVLDDDPIVIPRVGSVYWKDNGELSGDEQAISYLKECFQKAEKIGLTYSIRDHAKFFTYNVKLSDIQGFNFESMNVVLNFFNIEPPRYLYEYEHYEQPGILY